MSVVNIKPEALPYVVEREISVSSTARLRAVSTAHGGGRTVLNWSSGCGASGFSDMAGA
jgi:hypothetical protein